MAVEIIQTPDQRNGLEVPLPPDAASPPALAIELEAGGEALFRVPTMRDLKAIERSGKRLSLTDSCRELANACLISWGDLDAAPPDDEMDAADDQAILGVFGEQITEVEDFTTEYEVLPDRAHRVQLSCGSLTMRRPTRKDIRAFESSTAGKGGVLGDVLVAVGLTVSWWRGDRSIMPADFDAVPLAEFRRVSAALRGFLTKPARPNG